MKQTLCAAAGAVFGGISALLGGWDSSVATLLIFMAVDYFTGLLVAGVFHRSKKSPDGSLESRAGWKGICRKGVTLLVVLVAVRLDIAVGSDYIRDAVVIAFILNELLSIIENAGLMGVPMPEPIKRAIDVLKRKSGGDGEAS